MATKPDIVSLARMAADTLADTLATSNALHLDGARDRHRRELARAIALADEVLAAGSDEGTVASARSTLVRAHAARAQDARHGAGQLSRSSQRAPTVDDCHDGWRRVEAIVAVAEASRVEATRVATALDTQAGWDAARAAETAAQEARKIVDERNHAYTFHADPSFSFGEGWYLAAAATLADVTIQIEPEQVQTPQAEKFLRDAGLGDRLVPYRSRPRANKHLPEIVARAFRADPIEAQRRLRIAFLGEAPIPSVISDWTDGKLAGAPRGKKVLHWVRYGTHHPTRNTSYAELAELSRRALAVELVPVLIGDAIRDGDVPEGAIDLTLFWRLPLFQGADSRRAQLQLFEYLKRAHGLVGQLGVTTAGMDGPALMGLRTMYLTHEPNARLGTWVGAVPDYEEVVRDDSYLARISQTLSQWAQAG